MTNRPAGWPAAPQAGDGQTAGGSLTDQVIEHQAGLRTYLGEVESQVALEVERGEQA
jgi:hypothetical protein